MDKVKQEVVQYIQDVIVKHTNWNLVTRPYADLLNEASVISPLQSGITIRSINGSRLFIVQVKEIM